jgi:hypothetical protein
MTEKDDTASIGVEGDFFLSIGRDIDEIALDTIKSGIFSFWSRWCRFRHNIKLKYKMQSSKCKMKDYFKYSSVCTMHLISALLKQL